jgi:outer membrane receptor protein involved in Fe transport
MGFKKQGLGIFFRSGLAVTLLLSGAGLSSAAPVETQDDMFTLGEVVVTAREGGVEASQTLHEVTARDIEARNARTLDEAIQLLPGLNVRRGGDGTPRIDIRGLRTRHVILLVDGIPMNSAVDQQFDPTLIPVENIAKIKLTAGPSSVLYGQGGLAGVINVITKKGGRDVKGNVSYEAGDRQEYLTRASIGGSRGVVDFFLSGSAYHQTSFPLSDGFDPTPAQGSGYRINSDDERQNLSGNLGFQATKNLSLALTASYVHAEYGKPSSIIPASQIANTNRSLEWNLERGLDLFAARPRYQRIEGLEGFSIQAAADYAPKGPFSLRAWAYHNRLYYDDRGFDDDTYTTISRSNSYDVTVKSRIQGLTAQPRVDFGRAGILTASLGVENDKWENQGYTIESGNVVTDAGLDEDFNIYSLSLQYEYEPIKNLGLVVGYGHYWQDRSEDSDADFSVLAGIHYDFPTGTRLKAAFQRNVRFPTLDQLYAVDGRGNPSLKTERSYQYQVGVEQKLPGDSLISLTGFRTDAKDFIERVDDIIDNYDEYRFYGVEVAAETRFVKDLVVRASYSYLDSEDKSSGATRDELQYRPKHKVSFEGWYDFPFGLTPYVSVQHVADQVTYDRVTNAIPYKMRNYTLVNVKLSQEVVKNRLKAYFGVNNIFDEDYETSYGFPQEGRFIYGGIQLNI